MDQVENRDSFWSRIWRLCESLNEKEVYQLLTAVVLMLVICCIVGLYKKNDWLKWIRNALVIASILCCLLSAYQSFVREPFGVVTAPEVKVYSGLGKDNVVLFALHEGAEFTIAGQDWRGMDKNRPCRWKTGVD